MLFDRSTGSAAINREVSPAKDGQFEGIRIHLSAASATSENLVVTLVSNAGTEYDVVLDTQDMNTLSDYVYQPTRPHPFVNGDKIKVTWANTNTRTYGLEILWS